jgi:hypothetical protein
VFALVNLEAHFHLLFRNVIAKMKAMVLLTFVIRPWPPQDFGILVDSHTFANEDNGIQADAFMLYTKGIFGKDIVRNSNFISKVGLGIFQYVTSA